MTNTPLCALCQDTRHVRASEGFVRCPECFLRASLERVLIQHGYPKIWATASLEALIGVLGETHPVVGALNGLKSGALQCVHFYGGPSDSREAIFAATLRVFLTNSPQVNILDTADLAPKHFEKDRQMNRLKAVPTIITVGKEIERKLGAFYLRDALEFAVPRRLPLVLFSDADYDGLKMFYGDFRALYQYARFTPVRIPES